MNISLAAFKVHCGILWYGWLQLMGDTWVYCGLYSWTASKKTSIKYITQNTKYNISEYSTAKLHPTLFFFCHINSPKRHSVWCHMALETSDVSFLLNTSTTCALLLPEVWTLQLNHISDHKCKSQQKSWDSLSKARLQQNQELESILLSVQVTSSLPGSCRAITSVKVKHSKRKRI